MKNQHINKTIRALDQWERDILKYILIILNQSNAIYYCDVVIADQTLFAGGYMYSTPFAYNPILVASFPVEVFLLFFFFKI